MTSVSKTDRIAGTSREAISTPDEQIGYRATEEYASRMASPRPSSSASRPTSKAANQESALRNEASQEQLDDNGEVIHIDPLPIEAARFMEEDTTLPLRTLAPKVATQRRREDG